MAVPSLDAFDYVLPDELIAQYPAEPRDSARLLDATAQTVAHRRVRDIAELVGPGDVLVVNDTRVIPARLQLFKPTGGAVEVFLLDELDRGQPTSGELTSAETTRDATWRALVRPSRRVPDGTELVDATGTVVLRVGTALGDGVRVVAARGGASMLAVAHAHGEVPLPPYINVPLADADRYQTVYSRNERSVAAPTAGLHFTDELLAACVARGAQVERVELAVGLGTFRPILVDDIDDHTMHGEWFNVAPAVLDACADADRVIAIGTTSVRALESAAVTGATSGVTDLFISPGYAFKVVDTLFTNFHQPKSSLLVMLSAFAGDEWRSIYEHAIAQQYRFFSFGDAMIVNRKA